MYSLNNLIEFTSKFSLIYFAASTGYVAGLTNLSSSLGFISITDNKIINSTIAIVPSDDTAISSNSFNPFESYFVNNCVINVAITALPNNISIDSCLLVININNVKPANMNKSFSLIFVSVNISSANVAVKTTNISLSLINVNGKCSLILCVVLPFIVLYKYVYGVSPRGVKIPVNTHIIIISISHFAFLFLLYLILYGSFLFASLLLNIFTFFCSNFSFDVIPLFNLSSSTFLFSSSASFSIFLL